MPIDHCYPLGTDLGMDPFAVRRFLLQNPAAFAVSNRGGDVSLSAAASDLLVEERRIRKEPRSVFVVRKLLMMSQKETLPTASLLRCHHLFDFPELSPMFARHPNFFHWDRAKLLWARLRLVSWDPDLTVTSRERALALIQRSIKIKKRKSGGGGQEQDEDEQEERIFGAGSGSGIIPLENDGGIETMKPLQEIGVVYSRPMISPFDRSRFSPANKELDRQRKISVIHEFLSLTPSKSAGVADLHGFWQDLGLDEQRQNLESLLQSETRLFTTRMIQGRLAVFLNERYDLDHTPAMSPQFQAKRRFLDLVTAADRSLEEDAIKS